jgi:hypothetical protein
VHHLPGPLGLRYLPRAATRLADNVGASVSIPTPEVRNVSAKLAVPLEAEITMTERQEPLSSVKLHAQIPPLILKCAPFAIEIPVI